MSLSKVLLDHLETVNLEPLQEPQDVKDEYFYEHMNHQKLNEGVYWFLNQ